MSKFCITLRIDNFSLQKNLKNHFFLLLQIREHLKKFYRSAGVESLGNHWSVLLKINRDLIECNKDLIDRTLL